MLYRCSRKCWQVLSSRYCYEIKFIAQGSSKGQDRLLDFSSLLAHRSETERWSVQTEIECESEITAPLCTQFVCIAKKDIVITKLMIRKRMPMKEGLDSWSVWKQFSWNVSLKPRKWDYILNRTDLATYNFWFPQWPPYSPILHTSACRHTEFKTWFFNKTVMSQTLNVVSLGGGGGGAGTTHGTKNYF